jgi:nitroreductase
MQPWHFVVVSDPEVKRKIRDAAEEEERLFYHGRAPQEWLDALAPLGTDENKPYLEAAPFLIVVFAQTYGLAPDGRKVKNYYVSESVGIATGMLISALHMAGLVALTHTPSPMGFLNRILERPSREKPFLILVVGHPAGRCLRSRYFEENSATVCYQFLEHKQDQDRPQVSQLLHNERKG